MSQRPTKRIAASVLQRLDGKVLLLKRAPTHTTNPDKWCFVTGYIEEGEEPHQAAIRELNEELGLESIPSRVGKLVVVHTERGTTLHVYPFLFLVEDRPIQLDREHVDYVWIKPHELYQYDFVQQLDEDLMALGLL